MKEWFLYAIAAALLYGLHQVFTKLVADRIGDGLVGFIVEMTAALIIAAYLIYLRVFVEWKQPLSKDGVLSIAFGVIFVGSLATKQEQT